MSFAVQNNHRRVITRGVRKLVAGSSGSLVSLSSQRQQSLLHPSQIRATGYRRTESFAFCGLVTEPSAERVPIVSVWVMKMERVCVLDTHGSFEGRQDQ